MQQFIVTRGAAETLCDVADTRARGQYVTLIEILVHLIMCICFRKLWSPIWSVIIRVINLTKSDDNVAEVRPV